MRAIPGVVDVWRVDLDAAPDMLRELLCAQERARAARIVHERDRMRWARSRGMLRLLLARYLDADPRELELEYGEHGKPRLRGGVKDEIGRSAWPDGASDLRFNLSHSGELLLVAVTAGREVGVDVEVTPDRTRGEIDEPAIAARVLGVAQARRLAELDGEERTAEFLRAWTMREAAVKCLGVGLASMPVEGQAPAGGLWSSELDVGPRAFAALAVELTPPPASARR
jgi:4'-phosphopantetheinyl transferase